MITCSVVSLTFLTTLTFPVCQSTCAMAHSVAERSCPGTCSDRVPSERSGPVPALEMEVLVVCLWDVCVSCGVGCICISVSVCGVVWLLSSWFCLSVVVWWLSSMRCLLYLDIHTRRGNILWLHSRRPSDCMPSSAAHLMKFALALVTMDSTLFYLPTFFQSPWEVFCHVSART